MTKLEAWQAWCAGAGTEQLADQLTLMKSSHGKAFSYAWDAAAKAEREAIAQSLDKQADLACDEIDRQWAQPEQEPVAWADMDVRGEDKGLSWTPGHFHKTPLYTAPPQRKPLTLDELWRVFTRSGLSQFHQRDGVVEYKYEKCIEEFARAIEAAHGIKGEA